MLGSRDGERVLEQRNENIVVISELLPDSGMNASFSVFPPVRRPITLTEVEDNRLRG
jgi:hypothetical protein